MRNLKSTLYAENVNMALSATRKHALSNPLKVSTCTMSLGFVDVLWLSSKYHGQPCFVWYDMACTVVI